MSQILVVAYHPIVLKGICEVIAEKSPKSNVVATATDVKLFLSLLKTHKPEAAIIDVAITWKSEIDLLEEIYRIQPNVKLHFISVHPVDQSVQKYLISRVEKRFKQPQSDVYTPLEKLSEKKRVNKAAYNYPSLKASQTKGNIA